MKKPSEIYPPLKSVVKTNSRVFLGIEHVFQQNMKMMEMRTVLMVQMKLEEDLNQLKAMAMNQILSALIGKKMEAVCYNFGELIILKFSVLRMSWIFC